LSPEREEAELLLRKAREDQAAVVRFGSDSELSDGVIGFHAQQAIEKAVLRLETVDVPRTHDIRFLLESLQAAGVVIPDAVRAGESLAPWAVEFRYGEDLDRAAAIRVVGDVTDWAAGRFADR
jgi:HEPN domain-containing protein